MNPQAEELNNIIKQNNQAIYDLLSEKGKAIFFPKKGILAQTADAKGKEINATLGMALEDDGSPLCLSTISKQVDLPAKDAFNYAPSYGKPELRQKWKEMIFEKNQALNGKEISQPIVTNALTHGLSLIGYMFLDPGDKIILPEMFWGNYKLIFNNAYDAELNTFNLFNEGSFDIESMKAKLKEDGIGKKVLLLNFPNNPTGYTPTIDEIKSIVTAIKDSANEGNKIFVICDDAYFGLFYEDGIEKQSIFSYICDLHENVLAVKIDGATKEDYVWGFRIGFITYGCKGNSAVYTALEDKTAGAVRGNISNASHLSQSLILKSFTEKEYNDQKQEKYNTLQRRYHKVKDILNSHPEYSEQFKALPFNSGYFMCIELKNDAEKVRQILLEKYSTGIIAINNLIRVAFSATPYDKLETLFDNIYKAASECG